MITLETINTFFSILRLVNLIYFSLIILLTNFRSHLKTTSIGPWPTKHFPFYFFHLKCLLNQHIYTSWTIFHRHGVNYTSFFPFSDISLLSHLLTPWSFTLLFFYFQLERLRDVKNTMYRVLNVIFAGDLGPPPKKKNQFQKIKYFRKNNYIDMRIKMCSKLILLSRVWLHFRLLASIILELLVLYTGS